MKHYDPRNEDQHFFASTAFFWAVAHDPVTAVEKAKRSTGKIAEDEEGKTFVLLFHVPEPIDALYHIQNFAPVVEGITKVYEGKV